MDFSSVLENLATFPAAEGAHCSRVCIRSLSYGLAQVLVFLAIRHEVRVAVPVHVGKKKIVPLLPAGRGLAVPYNPNLVDLPTGFTPTNGDGVDSRGQLRRGRIGDGFAKSLGAQGLAVGHSAVVCDWEVTVREYRLDDALDDSIGLSPRRVSGLG